MASGFGRRDADGNRDSGGRTILDVHQRVPILCILFCSSGLACPGGSEALKLLLALAALLGHMLWPICGK